MSDDPKVLVLPTGYKPDTPPPNVDMITQLQWDISMLADEIRLLSVTLNKLTQGMVVMNNRQQEIIRELRK